MIKKYLYGVMEEKEDPLKSGLLTILILRVPIFSRGSLWKCLKAPVKDMM